MPYSRSLLRPLIRKLQQHAALGTREVEALLSLPVELRHCQAQEEFIRQRQCPDGVCVILSGIAIRYKLVPDGRSGLVSLCFGRLQIHDLPALRALAGFDPSYLHFADAARSELSAATA